jgi:hypothetical protein
MNDTWLLVIVGVTAFFIGAAAYQLTQRRSGDKSATAEAAPAKPGLRRYTIGELRVLSGTLLLGDLRRIAEPLAIDNVPTGTWPVLADVLVGAQGGQRVGCLTLKFGNADPATRALLGEVAVASGALVLLDRLTYQQAWKPSGPDGTAEALAATLKMKPSCQLVLDAAGGGNVVAVESAQGDGLYPVFGSYAGARLAMLEIPLIDPEAGPAVS